MQQDLERCHQAVRPSPVDQLPAATSHGLTFEIVAEQFPKGLGVVNDLLPMNGLLSSVRQSPNLLLDLLRLCREFLSPRLHFGEVDGLGLIGVEQSLILSLDSLSALEQL